MRDDLGDDWKEAFAETAFKRLYWQGFAGRFVQFDWPTYFDGINTGWPDLPDLRKRLGP